MASASDYTKTLILKIETTGGTAESLANSDFDVKATNIEVDMEIEEHVFAFASNRHSYGASTMGKRQVTFKCRVPLLLGAGAATAPKLGKFFKSAGALETVVADTSVAYTPSRTKDEGTGVSATIAVQYNYGSGNSVQVKGKGCVGTVVVGMENGALVADFEWTGALVGVTDETALVLTSPDTGTIPNIVTGATITVAAEAIQIDNFELRSGNTVELRVDNADTTGYSDARIGLRNPELSLNPRMDLLATRPFYTRYAAGTQVAFSAATAAVSGLKWTITAPKASLKGDGFNPGLRGQESTWDQTYSLRESSGNDEWRILQSA
jgi:hypothetical protein